MAGQTLQNWGSLWAIRQYTPKGARVAQLTEDNQGIGSVAARADAEPTGAKLGILIRVACEGKDEVKRRSADGQDTRHAGRLP